MIGTSGIMAQTPDLLDAFASVIPQSKETTPASAGRALRPSCQGCCAKRLAWHLRI
jgi:hypothetical protein